MAITDKHTIMRIKKMLDNGKSCPWTPDQRFSIFFYDQYPDHCRSCQKVMGLKIASKDDIRCPCIRIYPDARAKARQIIKQYEMSFKN